MCRIRNRLFFWVLFCAVKIFSSPLFDQTELRDVSTLNPKVKQDWHQVERAVSTRQKVMTINVGEVWPGQEYRVPVRLIVPADKPAVGFWLTGGNRLEDFEGDAKLSRLETLLINEGVGVVKTIVQEPGTWGQRALGDEMQRRFLKTLNPHFSIQYWGWPASLMRTVTAAYAEEDYFQSGKVAVSGGSKNGASPSVALIHDDRITAQHGTVSPLWDSPLRLCDSNAWKELRAYNKKTGVKKPHRFLGGTYGPVYNEAALQAGKSWADLQALADAMSDAVFISKNFQALEKRGVELLFEPGTHDFVCFDIAWGGEHYPQIPVFYQPNSGHGKKDRHPGAVKGAQNLNALLLRHFFPEQTDPLLPVPQIDTSQKEDTLYVKVTFPDNHPVEGGRLYWMFDRPPEGSDAYLQQLIPENNWIEMKSGEAGIWTGEVLVQDGAQTIDLFSSHWKQINSPDRKIKTAVSSPYQRIALQPF